MPWEDLKEETKTKKFLKKKKSLLMINLLNKKLKCLNLKNKKLKNLNPKNKIWTKPP